MFVSLAAVGNNDRNNPSGQPAEYAYDQKRPIDEHGTTGIAATSAYGRPQHMDANAEAPPPVSATIYAYDQPQHANAYRPPIGAASTYGYEQPQPGYPYQPSAAAAPIYGYDQPQYGYRPTPVVSQPGSINPCQPAMVNIYDSVHYPK